MENERYTITGDTIHDRGVALTTERVCERLNSLESTRKRKGNEISKLREVNELQREVICGVKAYLRLKGVWY